MMRTLLLLSCSALLVSCLINVVVDDAIDSWPDSANCQSVGSGVCNLRSAFQLCGSVGGEECIIDLPSEGNIELNITYGDRLNMTSDCNVHIRGNKATLSTSHFNPAMEIITGGFPLSTGAMTNTASATQNTQSACAEGCGGDVLKFTGCNYDQYEDTIYRLYNGANEVTSNDDFCNFMSNIEYSVPNEAPCSDYCLHAGCYGSGACTTTVQAYRIPYVASIEAVEIITGGFPLSTGAMTDTASATQNTQSACAEGCGGDILKFTGCNYDQDEDTIYRLYNGANEVASNDDFCNFMSNIEYSIPDEEPCSDYCLHAGCYGSDTCTTTVQAYRTRLVGEVVSLVFIYYLRGAADVSIPHLSIEALTIRGFDGALRLIGDVSLEITQVTFDANQHDYGGAVYLRQNAQPVVLRGCVFTGSSARSGGGLETCDAVYINFVSLHNKAIYLINSLLYVIVISAAYIWTITSLTLK
jgi:hypothetical protein